MSSEFSIIKCLQWCVNIPSREYPRESPVFLMKGNEYLFRFVLVQSLERYNKWHYDLHLEPKNKHAELKPFSGILRVGFKKQKFFNLGGQEFKMSDSSSNRIWSICREDLKPNLPPDYMDGNLIKFLFDFSDASQAFLKNTEEKEDKSMQTPSYIDANILLEGVSKDFSTLLDEGLYHDVEFVCGDDAIKAHKNILSCRSEVFASMLQADMIEKKTGQITIQDVEGTIFKQFLRYLYTGVLPELTVDVALRFYEASDKYAVDALKKQCASFLFENLSPENACEVLIIADRHNDSDFKKNVMEYMVKIKIPHIGEKWTEFCKGNPLLATEVLNLLFKHFTL